MSVLTKTDFEKVCRICLKYKRNMTPIRTTDVPNILQNLTTMNILDDSFPRKICQKCVTDAHTSYNFKKQCEHSERLLNEILDYDFEQRDNAPLQSRLNAIKGNNVKQRLTIKFYGYSSSNEFVEEVSTIDSDEIEKPNSIEDVDCSEDSKLWFNKIAVKDEIASDETVSNKCIKLETNADVKEGNVSYESTELENKIQSHLPVTDINLVSGLKTKRESVEIENDEYDIPWESINTVSKQNIASLQQDHVNSRITSERDKKLHCQICNKSFANMTSVGKHKKKHFTLKKKKLSCHICLKEFSELSQLTKHTHEHKEQPKNYTRHPFEPIRCNKCPKSFIFQEHFDKHMKSHSKQNYVCKECGHECKHSTHLKVHMRTHENEEYKFPVCHKRYSSPNAIQAHKKRDHSTNQKKEICSICGKVSYAIETHMKRHKKELPPFKCSKCPKSFSLQRSLKRHHQKIHDQFVPNMNYLCSKCGKRFESAALLRSHSYVHSDERNYPCKFCEKRFKTLGALVIHVRCCHTDDRPFICTVCKKGFRTKAVLNKHVRTHTGERPFACEICSKDFAQKTTLTQHMNVH